MLFCFVLIATALYEHTHKLCYLLKSDFSICQESFVKKPAEENIQTAKTRKERIHFRYLDWQKWQRG